MTDRFDSLIRKCADLHGVNWILVKAVIWQESDGDSKAESWCGARGLMQIMPRTGNDLGLKKDELLDPEKNIEAGTRFLSQLFGRFPEIPGTAERWKFALASYNGGRGHINKALRAAREKKLRFWYKWENAKNYLTNCDTEQIIHYVDGVFTKSMEFFLRKSPPKRSAVYSVLGYLKKPFERSA